MGASSDDVDRGGAAALLDASPEMILMLDPDGRILEVNAAYLKRYATTRGQVLGSNAFERFPAEVAQLRRRKLHEAIETRQEVYFADEHDGRLFETHMYPSRGDSGQVDRIAVYTHDVTEVHVTRTALDISEAKLRVITENLPLPVWVSRLADGRILFANEGLHTLLGLPPGSLLGERTPDLYEQSQDRASFLAELKQRGRVHHREVPIVLPDGQRRIIWASAEMIELDDEPVMMGSFIDVTERREAETQLGRLQRMDAVGQLAAGIAHDFNNLLTVIEGRAGMAIGELASDHPAVVELQQVMEASQRAAALTHQLLAYGRRQVLAPTSVDLNGVVRDMGRMLRRLIAENIRVEMRLADDLADVWVDPSQLQQVVMNLVLNARDAMPDGGTLTMETAMETAMETPMDTAMDTPMDTSMETPMETPMERDARARVRLSVRDTGTGMDAQTLARVFEPFFTTKASDEGTGLGLATVDGIVRQSGGEVRAESTMGAGSVFHVWLDASEGGGETRAAAAGAVAAGPGAKPSPRATVLVVEDEPMVRSLAERMLRSLGYEVLSAEHAEAARLLSARSEGSIDVLLTDIIMPGDTGGRLAEQLSVQRPDMAVVFMSGYSNAGAAPQVGAAQWLHKPFDRAALSAAIRTALAEHARI